EVEPTSIEVQSNEPEGSLVHGAVLADVRAAHEAHVRIEQQLLGRPVRVGRRPGALHVGDADEAVEVRDHRGIEAEAEEDDAEGDAAEIDGIGRRPGAALPDAACPSRGASNAAPATAADFSKNARRDDVRSAWCEMISGAILTDGGFRLAWIRILAPVLSRTRD